jgi:hypothetical protein
MLFAAANFLGSFLSARKADLKKGFQHLVVLVVLVLCCCLYTSQKKLLGC